MKIGDRGLCWTGVEKVLVYGINFVQGIVLARLLCPDDFGLSGMIAIFIALASLFTDCGFSAAIPGGGRSRRRRRRSRPASRS